MAVERWEARAEVADGTRKKDKQIFNFIINQAPHSTNNSCALPHAIPFCNGMNANPK
jgi:hypothetical protein